MSKNLRNPVSQPESRPSTQPFEGMIGVGLRPTHYPYLEQRPPVAVRWFEAISENYMDSRGRPLDMLELVRRDYPVALHGVSLSIASTEGIRPHYRNRRNGGIGAFTPDNTPIFDWIKDNVYLIADSNHGFKMTGVGKLLATQLVSGRPVEELKPFSFDRFTKGEAHGSGTTNCPWV